MSDSSIWQLATRRDVVRRAVLTALIVGAVLTAINHGPAMVAGQLPPSAVWQIPLTFLVPWMVSSWSAVAVLRKVQA